MADALRVLHTADLHILLTRYGHATGTGLSTRVGDFLGTLDRFVDTALERQVHVAVLAGDTFDNRHEPPGVRARFTAALERMTSAGITVVVCPGNHDGMTTVGDPSTHSLRWLHELRLGRVIVPMQPMRPMVIAVGDAADRYVDLTVYPYPHKRAFDEQLTHLDPDDRVLAAGRLLDDHIADAGRDFDRPGRTYTSAPRLFVGHLTVGGSTVGSERAMKFSWDVAISPHVLAPWDYVALGHIHKQQMVPGTDNAFYAGSPEYVDFSEVNDSKGFIYAEVQRGKTPAIEVIPSGARRAVRFDFTQTAAGAYEPRQMPGAPPLAVDWARGPIVLARFFPVDKPDELEQTRIERRLYEQGASFVKPQTIRPETLPAERIETTHEDGSAVTIPEATEAWLVAHDKPVEPTMTAARQLIAAK